MAVMFVAMLFVILAFCALALDVPQVYHRQVAMQAAADVAALAAAYELNGTAAGIRSAAQKAAARFDSPSPAALTYHYNKLTMNWSDDAIEFGPSARGPWMSYDTALAQASPNGLLYAKVDTGRLDPAYGRVQLVFMPVVSNDATRVGTRARAIAGRAGIAVTPLGICAMRPEPSRNRNGELEEYGFRRGVGYDLMQLGALSPTSANNYLIDPLIPPGSTGAPTRDVATIAPFVCSGTMAPARVMGGPVGISSPFPLSDLYIHLDSRFDIYGAPVAACAPGSAPPDRNIKAYTFNDASSVTWMTTAPGGQAAALSTADNKRWTVAGPDPTPAGTTAGQYGVLWSYAKAARYAAQAPASGYATFDTTSWSTLYSPGLPKAYFYPSTPPYFRTAYAKSPSHAGQADRRILNVALLSCPVSGDRATVLAVGRFFMTVPADATHLYAEFAGLVDEQSLRVQVSLYP